MRRPLPSSLAKKTSGSPGESWQFLKKTYQVALLLLLLLIVFCVCVIATYCFFLVSQIGPSSECHCELIACNYSCHGPRLHRHEQDGGDDDRGWFQSILKSQID